MGKFTVEITDANFEQEVAAAQVPVLLDFWAEWCGPCQRIAPVMDELAKEYGDKVAFGKCNTDENRKLAMQFNIDAIPAIMIFSQGQLVDRLIDLGMVIDLAHASQRTFFQVLERASDAPVMVSHACCRAVYDTPRNLSDEQLRALADHDGVLAVMAVPLTVDQRAPSLERVVDLIRDRRAGLRAAAIFNRSATLLG